MKLAESTKYGLLSEKFKDDIRRGEYTVGVKLPGEHVLAKKFNVSRVTVRQAMEILENDGFLIRKQGLGTFVKQLNGGKPIPNIESIALVLADLSPRDDYSIWEVTAAERWLANQNITISVATFNTANLVDGLLPPILTSGGIQGVLLDGKVENYHRFVLEKEKIPYVVVGDHPVNRNAPQVKFACKRMVEDSVKRLYDIKTQPVAIMIEPFSLHYTRELFEGYVSAVEKLPQQSMMQLCPDDDGYRGMKQFLKLQNKKFSIITTDKICRGILQVYQEEDIPIKDNPIVVIGSPHRLSVEERRQVYFVPLKAEIVALKAAQLLLEMIKGFRKSVYEEMYFELEIPVTTETDNI